MKSEAVSSSPTVNNGLERCSLLSILNRMVTPKNSECDIYVDKRL